ncbi:hypothetical protein EHQ24_09300 [Leptospira noumeaensis]|uniref:DUF4846 domain-containing protein n=1 Tax=Leptospira noumeaensis TaxID=2484964 RepID=A0A4R9I5X5_9LEPT|nr:DUF4846 domain-containing protein [Leptospira noumeaensis]TGK81498.1 hypothetical protein EHQ24_09300 [Leptospira noumeaensis]
MKPNSLVLIENRKQNFKIYIYIVLFLLIFSFQNLYADSIKERFPPPNNFSRVNFPKDSFASYLQHFPLKLKGSPVYLYNGRTKSNQVHAAVLDFPLLKDDLIQCADAVMKLRAEYFYSLNEYDKIQFRISNGMEVGFSRFAKGDRVKVSGNKTSWKTGKFKKGTGRDVFEEYLRFIYSYAGTISLKSELKKKQVTDLKPGDVWIEAGSPGHVVLIVDQVTGKDGQTLFLLAQSYMPSQEMHILNSDSKYSPWFEVPKNQTFPTPEWEFPTKEIYGFVK